MNIRDTVRRLLSSFAGVGSAIIVLCLSFLGHADGAAINPEIFDYFAEEQKYPAMDVKPLKDITAVTSGNQDYDEIEQKSEAAGNVKPANSVTGGAIITSEVLDYFKEEQRFVATGNVRIVKDSAVITADSAVYFDETADAELTGHVTIEDKDYLIKTEQADFNLDDYTGNLKNAVIYFKKENYWISGVDIQKIGDNHYLAKTAYFSICDTESYRNTKVLTSEKISWSQRPDWCFKGDDADILVGDKMSAKNANYRLKDTSVLYWPYFWTGIGSSRETGFELPAVGNDSRKGLRYSQAFFWAIDENKDATFNMDYFSKRGIGTGAQYRFLDFNHEGTWYAYHIRDSELQKDFVEVRINDKYQTGNVQTLLDVNYINSATFNQEYPKDFVTSINRFLQSTAEVSLPLNNSRVYLLSQYWVNLQQGVTEHVPIKLPELGYVINPTPLGPTIFTLQANAANFFRQQEPRGQRLDIQPTISYSFGDAVRLTQAASVRETSYNLTNAGEFGSSPHREIFQYDAQAQMRFIKDYGAFQHIIEPSVEYTFIPSAKVLPLFDSTELPTKTSLVTLSLFNKFVLKELNISLRLTQPYDFHGGNFNLPTNSSNLESATIASDTMTGHSLLPTRLEGVVAGAALPVNFSFDASNDFNINRVTNVDSNISFRVFRDISLGFGERYSRIDNLMLFTVGAVAPLSKHWILNINTWYDAKGPGLRDFSLRTSYKEQCWNIDLLTTRRPGDQFTPASYSYIIAIELKGIGSYKF